MHISALKVSVSVNAHANFSLISSLLSSRPCHVPCLIQNDMRQERAAMRKRIRELEGQLMDALVSRRTCTRRLRLSVLVAVTCRADPCVSFHL